MSRFGSLIHKVKSNMQWLPRTPATREHYLLSTINLLIKVAYFVWRINNVCIVKSSWSKLVSSILSLSVQLGFPAATIRAVSQTADKWKTMQGCTLYPRNLYGRWRLSIVDLLVLTSFDQLLLIMKRRSTILSLLFHLVFPDLTLA